MQTVAAPKPQSLYRKVRHELHKIDTKFGRQIFGDDNPLTRHIRYKIDHAALRLRSGYKPAPGPRLFGSADLKRQGYMVFENLYKPDLITTIRTKMEAGFNDPAAIDSRVGSYSYYLRDVHKKIPEVAQLITPSIMNAMSDYYGAHADVTNVIVWRNLPPDANAPPGVYSSAWHCDRRAHTMMKMFYLVHDTDETQGPLHIMDRPYSQEVIRKEFTNRLEMDRLDERKNRYIKLTGKAGTILFGNLTHCLHRAGLPAAGKYRDIIQFIFFPSAKPMPAGWATEDIRFDTDLGRKGQ